MKLILTHEVTGLGAAGDIIDVRDGYARNYLLPRNLATPWTKGGQKQVDSIQKARSARAVKSLEEAKGIKGQLEGRTLTIAARAGAGGRLFGAVSATDVAEAAKAAGITIDRRKVEFAAPIRALGAPAATVALHTDIKATLKLDVVSA